jgi:hypothetical protein
MNSAAEPRHNYAHNLNMQWIIQAEQYGQALTWTFGSRGSNPDSGQVKSGKSMH